MTLTATEPVVLTQHLTSSIALAATEGSEGKREFECLAVPYEVDVEREIWQFGTKLLRIATGSMEFRDDAKLFYGHDTSGTPLGRVVTATETDAGPRVLGRLWKTTKADEIYALMLPDEDGVAVLDRVSVGFHILEYSVEGLDTDSPVLVVTKAEVFELSIVPFPQYDGAAVDNVLHESKGKPMTGTPTAVLSKEDGDKLALSIETLAADVQTLAGKVSTMSTGPIEPTPDAPVDLFATYGDYVKAMLDAKHELHAEAEKVATVLAFEGGVVDDTTYGDTWVGDITRFIEKARKFWNLFDTGALPTNGMTLEYGQVVENDIDVEQQLEEGDALVMGNIKLGTATADVFTFGGGSEMSLQAALRSSINVLDFTWKSLARAYGKTTNEYVKYVLTNLTGFGTVGSLAALDDTDAWTAFLIDVGLYYDDLGLEPEYLRVSKDVLTTLANLRQGVDGPHVLNREMGTVNLLNAEGNVSGVKLALSTGTGVLEFGNSFALKTYESSGAPTRLGPQQDILHLTEAVGVYGFAAVAIQEPKAILRVGA